MATKTSVKQTPAPKKAAKSEKKSASPKALEKVAVEVVEMETTAVDLEEMEEQEEENAAAGSAGGGNAAALAAASGNTEMSASFKNFRHHPDMENFYRFIFENDLRHEALAIIDDIIQEKSQRKLVKGSKAQPH